MPFMNYEEVRLCLIYQLVTDESTFYYSIINTLYKRGDYAQTHNTFWRSWYSHNLLGFEEPSRLDTTGEE